MQSGNRMSPKLTGFRVCTAEDTRQEASGSGRLGVSGKGDKPQSVRIVDEKGAGPGLEHGDGVLRKGVEQLLFLELGDDGLAVRNERFEFPRLSPKVPKLPEPA
jgi:hypothetical protein